MVWQTLVLLTATRSGCPSRHPAGRLHWRCRLPCGWARPWDKFWLMNFEQELLVLFLGQILTTCTTPSLATPSQERVSDDVAEGCGSRPQPRCGWVAAQRTQESSLGPVAEFAWQEIHLFLLLLKYCDFIRVYYSISLAYPGREGLTSLQINSTFTNNSVFTTPVLGCSWSIWQTV